MTSSNKFIKSLATHQSKIRKITLATLIVAVSLSVAIEIGYTTSLAQGYTSNARFIQTNSMYGKGTRIISKRDNTGCGWV